MSQHFGNPLIHHFSRSELPALRESVGPARSAQAWDPTGPVGRSLASTPVRARSPMFVESPLQGIDLADVPIQVHLQHPERLRDRHRSADWMREDGTSLFTVREPPR